MGHHPHRELSAKPIKTQSGFQKKTKTEPNAHFYMKIQKQAKKKLTLASILSDASLHFNNLINDDVDITTTAFDTSTIMRTVGRVVCRLCAWGGLTHTGIKPTNELHYPK